MKNIYQIDKCLAGNFFHEEIIQLLVQLCYWPCHPTGTWPSFKAWKEKLHSSAALPDSLPTRRTVLGSASQYSGNDISCITQKGFTEERAGRLQATQGQRSSLALGQIPNLQMHQNSQQQRRSSLPFVATAQSSAIKAQGAV